MKKLIPPLFVIFAAIFLSILFLPNLEGLGSQLQKTSSSKLKIAPDIVAGPQNRETSPPKTGEEAFVSRVIDGDTIELSSGARVRYIGIDTPETVDPRKAVQCFGKEAAVKNRELVEGKKIILVKDVSNTDKYGRLLRYVWVPSPKSGEAIFVNEFLVKEGYAQASSYPPDVKYQEKLQEAETFAREGSSGLWGSCSSSIAGVQRSENYRLSPVAGCNIKGNISSSEEKIYHVRGQRFYDKTVIDEARGERWFCSEDEAVKAGWRRSKV